MKFIKRILFLSLLIISINQVFSYADDEFDIEELEYYSITETSSNTSKEPITSSKNIVVLERNSNRILYEKNSCEKVPIASTTKIMTAIIVLENSNLSEILTVSKESASINGSKLGLNPHSKISLNDCLYGLMLRSGNDCALALAEHISNSTEDFVTLMNEKAKSLGLTNTHFTSPHGLDNEKHYSTAYELAILTNYALKNDIFRKIVSTKSISIIFNNKLCTISNTNELLGSIPNVYGVKTGFTSKAGRCLVSSCKKGNLDLIIVVLGANTKKQRTTDSINLINYIFKNYKMIDISDIVANDFSNFQKYFHNNILLLKTQTTPIIELENTSNFLFPIVSINPVKLKSKIYFTKILTPDTPYNSEIGKFELYNNNELLLSLKILLKNSLTRNSLKYYFYNSFKSLFSF